MTEGHAPTQDAATDAGLLPREQSERLKKLGFEPGIPLHLIEDVTFALEDVKSALFGSTYEAPITVTFRDEREVMCEEPIGYGLPMVVELMQAVYVPSEPHVGSGLFGCHNRPDWYVRGFLYKSGFDPYPEVVVMHAYLQIDDRPDTPSRIASVHVQVARHSSGVDASSPLVYAADPREDG